MDEPTLKILVNSGVTMSRGKYAAQAVHAALLAFGVHPHCRVVVLGASPPDVAACSVVVHDAGRTEVEPGTLTAGAAEIPQASDRVLPPGAVETVEYGWIDDDGIGFCCRRAPDEASRPLPKGHTHSRRVFTWPDQPNTPTHLVYGWTPIEETTT